MPNWCDNKITISGDIEKMKPIVEKLRECKRLEMESKSNQPYVMETLLGTDDRPKDYDKGGWYQYNLKVFGVKWDFLLIRDCSYYEITEDGVTLHISTAWSPPETFLVSLCKKYDIEATIEYSEPGMDFAGSAEYNKDGCITQTTSTFLKGLYDNNDYFWEEVENLAYSCDGAYDEDSLKNFKESLSFLSEDEMKEAIEIYYNITKQEQA